MKKVHVDYRMIDLIILSVLAIACEIISHLLHQRWTNSGFYMSFSYLIVLISLIRWGRMGVVVNLALTLPLIFFSNQLSPGLVVYYVLTSLSVIGVPLLIKKVTKATDKPPLLAYGLGFYSLTLVARGAFSFLIGLSFIEGIQQTMLQLNFSVLISFLVLVLLKNTEGLLENMNDNYKDSQEVVE